MEATLRLPRRTSYAEYLEVERGSAHRHEFLDGVVVAMAGGSDEHNAIAGRLAMLLGVRLGAGSRYFTPDQRFWIAARTRSRYSDGSVICGKPEHPPHDGQASTNPVIIVEVLSPSTEGTDDGDKRQDFQSLPTLRAYVLVHQDERCVRVYRRSDAGAWPAEPEVVRDGGAFALPGLTSELAVAEVFADILDAGGRSLLR